MTTSRSRSLDADPGSSHRDDAGNDFRFISIQNPDEAKDRTTKRMVRSHAVKQALQRKRRAQRPLLTSASDSALAVGPMTAATQTELSLPKTPPPGIWMVSELAAEASRSAKFMAFLNSPSSRQATEPVFSLSNEIVAFQDFRSVFRDGGQDPALVNAVLFALTFAMDGHVMTRTSLGYQSQAMRAIRARMSNPNRETTESTMGAILLLAGVEAKLGSPVQVQMHMAAIREMLEQTRSQRIYLTDGMKRAIFWQDLYSSVFAGSERIVDHNTFGELMWRRDPFTVEDFVLAPGFAEVAYLLTPEFIEILEDINALQFYRESSDALREEIAAVMNFDNRQASVTSRIMNLPKLSPFLECCYLSAYLCAMMTCCRVWRNSIMPLRIAANLLVQLEEIVDDPMWNTHPGLLAWMLYMGGAFSNTSTQDSGEIRAKYRLLIQQNTNGRFREFSGSWSDIRGVMSQFVWSDLAYGRLVKKFWEECSE